MHPDVHTPAVRSHAPLGTAQSAAAKPPGARVTIQTRRLWTLRASLAATRWLLYAAALAGIAVTVRNAVAPAAPRLVRVASPPVEGEAGGAAGAWFALRFARAYLSWSPESAERERALAPFLAAAADPGAGMAPAANTRDAVTWEAIAAARRGRGGITDYTVAAGAASGAVRYLALAVARGREGAMTLTRYPALVAAPPAGRASGLDGAGLPALQGGALAAVLDRALRNYVSGSAQNLAADLAPGARVEPAAPGLVPRGIERLAGAGPDLVLATVVATDGRGDTWTLAYEVAVARRGGRWEITRIGS